MIFLWFVVLWLTVLFWVLLSSSVLLSIG